MSSIERVVTSSLFTWRLPFSTVSSFWSVFHCNISFFCFLYRSPKQPSFARNRDEVPIRNQRALDTIVNIRSSCPCLRGETFFYWFCPWNIFFFSFFQWKFSFVNLLSQMNYFVYWESEITERKKTRFCNFSWFKQYWKRTLDEENNFSFLKIYVYEASKKFVSNSNRKVREQTEITMYILPKYSEWLILANVYSNQEQLYRLAYHANTLSQT